MRGEMRGVMRGVMRAQKGGGRTMAQAYMTATSAVEALRENIREEHELYMQFVVAVRKIVTPIQAAVSIVQVWRAVTVEVDTFVMCHVRAGRAHVCGS
jgi:predicted GTPase